MDHGREIERYDEHRPAHAEDADECPLFVHGVLDDRDSGRGEAGGGREDHRCRVRAVEAHDIACDGHRIRRARRERKVMTDTDPCPALNDAHPHRGAVGQDDPTTTPRTRSSGGRMGPPAARA